MQTLRRPLIGIALAGASGLWLEQTFQIHPLLLLSAAAFLFAAVLFFRASLSIYLLCGILAAAYIGIRAQFQNPSLSHAETFAERQTVRGTIIDDPAELDGQTLFRLRVNSVLLNGEWFESRADIQVYLRNPPAQLFYGEQWQLHGRYTSYPKRAGGLSGYFSTAGENAIRTAGAPNRWLGRCYAARRNAAGILAAEMDGAEERLQLLEALLLGLRRSLPEPLLRIFAFTGTLHIFAISGLHVGVMASILIAVLKAAGVPRKWWGVWLIPLLFTYVASTGMKASALRAFTMAAVYFIAPLFGRKPDVPSAIAFAALLLLLIRPEQISDPGFLLSFVVVCGLVMVHSFVMRRLRQPAWDEKLNRRGFIAGAIKYVAMMLVTSIAAWLFSTPYTARFFSTVSPAAILGNLAVIPLTFIIVSTGCLSLLSGAFFMPAALIFNHANRIFTAVLITITQWFAALPGAHFFIRAPSTAVMIFWFAGVSFFFTGPARLRKPAAALFCFSIILWAVQTVSPANGIEIFKPADSATAIRIPERGWVLVTDGNRYQTTRTVRFLQQNGVNRLDELIISRKNATPEAIEQFKEIFNPRAVTTLAAGAPVEIR